MNKTVAALQRLFMELGGDLAKVKDCKTTVEVLNAISEKYDGEGGAKLTAKAIDNIANVAGNIGGGGEPEKYTIRITNVTEEANLSPSRAGVHGSVLSPFGRGDTLEFSACAGEEVRIDVSFTFSITDSDLEMLKFLNSICKSYIIVPGEHETTIVGYVFIMPNHDSEDWFVSEL